MLNWLLGKDINSVIGRTRRVKVCGIFFRIKKLDAFDFANGSQIMLSQYQTYEEAKAPKVNSNIEAELKKVKDHYRDVILSAVVEPKLARSNKEEGILVDNLFTEQELVEGLYSQILLHTYGKKKLKL
jgi:hypothetical protein